MKEIFLYCIIAFALIGAVIVFVLLRKNFNNALKFNESLDRITRLFTYDGYLANFKNKDNSQVCFLSFKINDAKDLEDLIGTNEYNKILKNIASVILTRQEKYRKASFFNYNNFSLILRVNDTLVATKIANEIEKEITSINNEIYKISLSWGIALGVESNDTFNNSLIALKFAKREKANVLVYSDEIAKKQAKFDEIISKPNQLYSYFDIYYQPKVNPITGEIKGAEALIRLVDEKKNIILYPNEFIDEFEEAGIITKIDLFVLDNACRILKKINEKGDNIHISVNMSKLDFRFSEIVEDIRKIISKHGINANLLHIELSESALVKNEEFIVSKLKKLNSLGLNIEIDSFGNNYSNISSLASKDYQGIKLGKSFLNNNLKEDNEVLYLKKYINLFRELNKNVTIVGVENEYVLDEIRNIRSDILVQGYCFYMPLKEYSFIEAVNQNRALMAQEQIIEEVIEEIYEEPQEEIIEEVIEEVIEEPQEEIIEEVIEEIFEESQEDIIEEVIEEVIEEPQEKVVDDNIINDFILVDNNLETQGLTKQQYEKKFFLEKLLNLSYIQKDNYNILKNALSKYVSLKNMTSKYFDNFLYKNKIICKLGVVGKTIRLYLALDPNAYNNSKFPHKDVSDKKRHAKTPYLMKISSNLSVKRALKLIVDLAEKYNLTENEQYENENFVREIESDVVSK